MEHVQNKFPNAFLLRALRRVPDIEAIDSFIRIHSRHEGMLTEYRSGAIVQWLFRDIILSGRFHCVIRIEGEDQAAANAQILASMEAIIGSRYQASVAVSTDFEKVSLHFRYFFRL